MAETGFELIFALPEGVHERFALMDAVFVAGFEDAVVGTGVPGMLGVTLEAAGGCAGRTVLDAARAICKQLPAGSVLREVREGAREAIRADGNGARSPVAGRPVRR